MREIVGRDVEIAHGEEMLAADAERIVHRLVPVGLGQVDIGQFGGLQQISLGRIVEHIQIPTGDDMVGIIRGGQQFTGSVVALHGIVVGCLPEDKIKTIFQHTIALVHRIVHQIPGIFLHVEVGIEHLRKAGVHIEVGTVKIILAEIVPYSGIGRLTFRRSGFRGSRCRVGGRFRDFGRRFLSAGGQSQKNRHRKQYRKNLFHTRSPFI